MLLTIRLTADAAAALQRGEPGPGDQVAALVCDAGGTFEPQHPGIDDPALAEHYSADVPEAAVDALKRQLQALDAVTAAYGKPPVGLP